MSKAGKTERAGLLYARCATEALNFALYSLAGRFVELGWKELPESEPTNVVHMALSKVEKELSTSRREGGVKQ